MSAANIVACHTPKPSRRDRRRLGMLTIGLAIFWVNPIQASDQRKSGTSTPQDEVSVANFTATKVTDIGAHLAKELSPELKSTIKKNNLTVFVLSTHDVTLRMCFAMVGLTEKAPAGLNPRKPSWTVAGVFSVPETLEWDADLCENHAVTSAINVLKDSSDPALTSRETLERSLGTGGVRRTSDLPDSRKLWIVRSSNVLRRNDSLFGKLGGHNLARAVDYRHTSLVVASYAQATDDGEILCFALAGLAGRAPEGRTARLPSSMKTAWLRGPAAELSPEGCAQAVEVNASEDLLSQPWTPDGILYSFSRSREADVPMPDPQRVAAVAKEGAQRARR